MFQKLRVNLKGHDQPIEIQTTARDWASIRITDELTFEVLFQIAYNGLRRTGVDVADDYDQFLDDQILELPQHVADPAPLDPTPPEVSGISP